MHPPTRPGDPSAAPASSGPGLLDAVLAEVVQGTGASVGMVYLSAPGEQVLRLAVVSGVSRQIAAPWERIPPDASIPVADAIRERRLVWLGSQEEMARRYPNLGIVLPYDFMLAAAPLAGEHAAWGGIVLLWPIWHPPQLSPQEREAITASCRRAALHLEHAAVGGRPLLPADEPRVLTPPRRHETDPVRAQAALDFTERLPTGCCALDLDGRTTFINPAAADLLDVGAATLVGRRPWEALLWLYDPVFEDRYRAAVITRQPASFTALRPPDSWLFFELYPGDHGISVHITPATARPSTTAPGQQPAAEQVGAMGLYHLTHLAAALAQAAGMREVAALAADQIVPSFGPQGMAVLTAEEGRLRIVGHRGYPAEFIDRFDGTPLADTRTPAARALTTGTAAFFATPADLQRTYPTSPRYPGRNAWAFLPLTASDHAVGALILSYDRPRPFPPAERALLTSLAGLVAQALDRARLYDTTRSLARTLQTGLLPHTLPPVPGLQVVARYRPAEHGLDIGGDFYDLIRTGPTTATAVIGDVQGHNTTAAALMGQVRTAVHAHATAGTPPGHILAATNRLLADLDPGLFTSCLIAHLDLTHHRAHLATAGHPPPLLRHPDGHTEIPRLPPGLLLGIETTADYPTTEIPLPPGTLLALYTDGLVETPGTDIDDALADLAIHLTHHHEPDLDTLTDSVLQYATRTTPPTDDIALLVLRTTRPQPGT
ncbi:SpoIIE family protein phosphatase [Streptomyces sp. NRRL B-24484]|uniref:SpoIIE family protein phosphatase n=1 Tax=Streptomyces sp. NRRL B-24484 TaxID=1463833 RepID=UPI0004C1A8D4|nr:SpoIIE family protein phosphatase [Streptomyces sp. NRRL B-24484]